MVFHLMACPDTVIVNLTVLHPVVSFELVSLDLCAPCRGTCNKRIRGSGERAFLQRGFSRSSHEPYVRPLLPGLERSDLPVAASCLRWTVVGFALVFPLQIAIRQRWFTGPPTMFCMCTVIDKILRGCRISRFMSVLLFLWNQTSVFKVKPFTSLSHFPFLHTAKGSFQAKRGRTAKQSGLVYTDALQLALLRPASAHGHQRLPSDVAWYSAIHTSLASTSVAG